MRLFCMLLAWLCYAIVVPAQDENLVEANSEIGSVKVFLESSQIHRYGKVALKKGKNKVVFSSLSPYLEEKTIKLTASGVVTVLSVNTQVNFEEGEQLSEAFKTIQDQVNGVRDSLELLEIRSKILEEERTFLQTNKSVGGNDSGIKLEELKSIANYYGERMQAIAFGILEIKKKREALADLKKRLIKKMGELDRRTEEQMSEIVILIDSEIDQSSDINFSYLTQSGFWYPSYDIRVSSVDAPIELITKVTVSQNSGEDWRNVQLSFSNARPNDNSVLPELQPEYARFVKVGYSKPISPGYDFSGQTVSGIITDESGEPLIGAAIQIKGTSVGSIADLNGRFSLQVPGGAEKIVVSYTGYEKKEVSIKNNLNITLEQGIALEEVVVSGLAGRVAGVRKRKSKQARQAVPAAVLKRTTSVEFNLDFPYTVLSNGESYTMDLMAQEVDAIYTYEAAPKEQERAFLTARIPDWNQYQILDGEANLFFEETFIGRSLLDTKLLSDTLSISLGGDDDITVKRERLTEFSRTNFIGNKKADLETYRISVRNNKDQEITITVRDQIPVSTDKRIQLKVEELSGGIYEEITGMVYWKRVLAPKEQADWMMTYELKYPRYERLVRE